MEKNNKPEEFWIVNTSKRDVMLSDLSLSVKSYKSVNLLDSKHYYYTWEQVFNSVTSGSIFKKRNIISVRKSPPPINNKKILIDKESPLPRREKSIFEIKKENFAELELTDEQFAEEISE